MKRIEVSSPQVKFVVVLGGTEYPMSRLKLGAARDFEDRMEAAKVSGRGSIRVVMDYLIACGLPETVVAELDQDQMQEIVEALNSAKKN